jgi:uncharacterized protein YndB with AHSA1/START domain
MSVNKRLVDATPDQVWDVLADGWLYPLWVVGASRMRDVDESWPEKGARLHHSVGVWPALINDYTEVLESVPGRAITLRAKGWPLGEAKVHIRLEASGAKTEVVIEEEITAGPGVLVPGPLKGVSIAWRNSETLRRLAFVVEGRR